MRIWLVPTVTLPMCAMSTVITSNTQNSMPSTRPLQQQNENKDNKNEKQLASKKVNTSRIYSTKVDVLNRKT